VDKVQQQIQRTFGSRVRELRVSGGVSQEELALKAGLDRSYVGQVERGERNVSLTNIHKLADGLGVCPDVLFQRSSDHTKKGR
jgi:transcriptional regulator with XRE-family HTH domain